MFLQHSCPKGVLRLLKAAGFAIAGVLLLGPADGLAQSSTRVCKDGVIYYYFPGQDRSRPRATVTITPPKRGTSPTRLTKTTPKARKDLINPEAVFPAGASDMRQLMPGTSEEPEDLRAGNSDDAKGGMLPGTRQLLGLLTKMFYRYPIILPTYANRPRQLESHKDLAAVQGAKIVVPDAWEKILKEAREQPFQFGQMYPGEACLIKPGAERYSFPVAWPFSFRDSWGDFRSGGRMHRAVDIVAPEGSAVYAVTGGVIDTMTTFPEAGITLIMRGQDGRGYGYMHLQGYAAGMAPGKVLRPGELIGYVGRTGVLNSEAHLHFQVYANHCLHKDGLQNPYYFLVQLCHGVGVTDLNQPKMARLENPPTRANQIQVYRRPGYATSIDRKYRGKVLVIKNF